MLWAKEGLKAQQYTKIFLMIVKVFSLYDFGVPGMVHFLLFEVP